MNIFALRRFAYNEGPKFVVLALILSINAIYFGLTFVHYDRSMEYFYLKLMLGSSLPVARASAACLNLNCALAGIPVCRNLLSVVRRLCLSARFVKRNIRRLIDENVKLHRLLASLICLHTIVHALAHYRNVEQFVQAYDLPVGSNASSLLRTLSELQPDAMCERRVNPVQRAGSDPLLVAVSLLPGWTGVLLCVCLMAIVATAAKAVRRANFEFFWFTHKLFIVFYFLLLIHGLSGAVAAQSNIDKHRPDHCYKKYKDWGTIRAPECPLPVFYFPGANSWKWLMLPMSIYCVEKLLRLIRRFEKVEIVRIVRHPLRVLEIRMRKRAFSASPGEYVFVLVPQVSRIQWHPFTLTSAPDDPHFSLHIRVAGDWTDAVEKLLSPYSDKDLLPSDRDHMPQIYVDGPYGTASEGVDQYPVSILIGCGIGVTPFASILRDLWHHIDQGRQLSKLKRLYFYWICPDYRAFEWFANSLQELERDLSKRDEFHDFLQIRIHLTGSVASHSVAEIAARISDPTDSLTGLKSKTYFGRPDWDVELKRLATDYPDTSIGIFFCGPAPLAKQISNKCNRCSTSGSTLFYFNQENF